MERQLVERARQGDPDAFDRLTEIIMDRLFAVAFRILRDTQKAEDVTQQTLVAIWRHLPQLRDADRFQAWSYRLLVNATYTEHRRRRHELSYDEITEGVVESSYGSIDDRDQIERGFERLSAEQRAVLCFSTT